jgi:hypothetical protein
MKTNVEKLELWLGWHGYSQAEKAVKAMFPGEPGEVKAAIAYRACRGVCPMMPTTKGSSQ